MSQKIIHIEDGEAIAFGRGSTSPSSAQPRRGDAQILEFQKPTAAALLALEDAMEPDTFESLGSIAVRLLADWKLPRIRCRSVAWEEVHTDRQPSRP